MIFVKFSSMPSCINFNDRSMSRTAICRMMILISVLAQVFFWSNHVTNLRADTLCPGQEGWTRLNAPESGRSPQAMDADDTKRGEIFTVAADWSDAAGLYVGGRNALYRSQDCGATWDVVWQARAGQPYPIRTLAATQAGRLYVGSNLYQPVLASDDYGVTMREVERSLMPIVLEASPSDPDVAYILAWYGGGNRFPERRPMHTADGGRTWSLLPSIAPSGAAIVDPADATTVYVLGRGNVQVSRDGARTFSPYSVYDSASTLPGSQPAQSTSGSAAMSWDGSRTWYISASGQTWYRGLDRAMYWQQLPDAPLGEPVRRIATSPHDPKVFFAVARGDELWAYREPESVP
jgi:hypothetical protein